MNYDILDKEQIINILNDTLECVDKQAKEIERLNKIIEIKNNRIQQLMSRTRSARIDKAIEYLTDEGVCILNKGMKENERLVWTWENYYDLLDILKGVDKE